MTAADRQSERDLQRRIQLALSQRGARTLVNDTGVAISSDILRRRITPKMVGKTVGEAFKPGRDYRRISFGQVGSPDLLGAVPVGGLPLAIGVEVKRPGERPRPEQRRWHAAARRSTGLDVIVARSVDEAIAGLEERVRAC